MDAGTLYDALGVLLYYGDCTVDLHEGCLVVEHEKAEPGTITRKHADLLRKAGWYYDTVTAKWMLST